MNWIYLIPLVAATYLIVVEGDWKVALAIVLVLSGACAVQWLADLMAGRRKQRQR